jgi:hypothetical protein
MLDENLELDCSSKVHAWSPNPDELLVLRENVLGKKHKTRLVQEGAYVPEVDIELIYTGDGWSPYLSPDEAHKLDDVREELRRGELKAASKHARVYSLTPIAL